MQGARVASSYRQQLEFFLHPSALLLMAQFAEILLYPATEHTNVGRALLGSTGIVVLLTTLRLIHHTKQRVWYAAGLAVAAVVLDLLTVTLGFQQLRAWQAALQALFYFYAVRCLIAYIPADRRGTLDELFAAAATFTLIVWAFTQLYELCQLLQPAAFGDIGSATGPRSWSELMFMSFSLFTSNGIGTTVPMTAVSRAVGDIEMFSGPMYLALVVSRLVSIVAGNRLDREG